MGIREIIYTIRYLNDRRKINNLFQISKPGPGGK